MEGIQMQTTIYTIGYSGFTRNEFVRTAAGLGIDTVIDVRSNPHSHHSPEYNCTEMEDRLKTDGIRYRNYAEEFGARQENRAFYSDDGILDFEVFSASEQFLRGVEKVIGAMEKGSRIALMCKEEQPIDCHRAILVARAFHDRGYCVQHICPDGILTQEELEIQLLNRYFPDRARHPSPYDGKTDAVLLQEAYRLRNRDIGYHRKPDADPGNV